MTKPKTYTIELDCAPMTPRPSTYLPGVLKSTGLKIDPENTVLRFFGNWTWEIPEDQVAKYEKVRGTIEKRITVLYMDGKIRYGSW